MGLNAGNTGFFGQNVCVRSWEPRNPFGSRTGFCCASATAGVDTAAAATAPPSVVRKPRREISSRTDWMTLGAHMTNSSPKDTLGHFHVDADIWPVDELRDRDVADDAHELIGLMFRETARRSQKVDHILNRC